MLDTPRVDTKRCLSNDVCLLVNSCWNGKCERDFSIVLLLGTKNGYTTITLTLTQAQKIMRIAGGHTVASTSWPTNIHVAKLVMKKYLETLKKLEILSHRHPTLQILLILIFTSPTSLNGTRPGSPALQLV
nr:Mariner Mos1 transposase [Hymenolepis microstoma]